MKNTIAISKKTATSTHERIAFLDSLRAIAIIMVVGVHTLDYCIPLPEYQKTIISFIVHTISVPIFFLVDGYLFARITSLHQEYIYFNSVKKSIFRLLIPWIIFTFFYSISRYFFEKIGFLQEKLIVGHSFQEIALYAYGSVYAPQLYFLLSLFIIRILKPILNKIIFIKNYFLIISLFIFYYILYIYYISIISQYLNINGGQEPIIHAIWGFQFYFFGIIVFKTSEIINLKKIFIPFSILFIIILIVHNDLSSFGKIIIQYSYLTFTFLLFFKFGDKFPTLHIVGKNTMGVYLIHAPIVLKGVSIILNKFIFNPILSFASVLISTFIISFCITIIVRYIPYGNILFGETHKLNYFAAAKKRVDRTR